jgi:hypothetical protein
MFTDAAYRTRPVGSDRRGFLKELGLGGIALASLLADQKAIGARVLPSSSSCSWWVVQVSLRPSTRSRS